jgi:hypothetical protein
MTVLEGYKLKVDALRVRLSNVSSADCTNEVLELVVEAFDKLGEMMDIIVHTGDANGSMATALQIMLDDRNHLSTENKKSRGMI